MSQLNKKSSIIANILHCFRNMVTNIMIFKRRRDALFRKIVTLLMIMLLIYLMCPGHSEIDDYRGFVLHKRYFEDWVISRSIWMNVEARSVLVFVHIPKSGGTEFGFKLCNNLYDARCNCTDNNWGACECKNHQKNTWMFSPYSVGWPCGVHASLTAHRNCVDETMKKLDYTRRNRTYFYITILRDPVLRYISEWNHQKKCTDDWYNTTKVPELDIDEFMQCVNNPANNRQTRMLSDEDAYKHLPRGPSQDEIMLRTAKKNLKLFSFFGLTEYMIESQYLFENSLGLHFAHRFGADNSKALALKRNLTETQIEDIIGLNKLDIQLYQYAKDIFFQRYKYHLDFISGYIFGRYHRI
ncbi:unnamed protein product [Owenia fusiformis]|uniref:Heparan-sulfate 6-O-sulfotransferase n=1 Tax=Owenia fusiformis TaxID=6347 RepID=A0A8J1XE44_OWEFU|nr:unnamed protein product [Owenia fusiformis]